ncbi:MAG: formyl transferase [Chitinophagaceae bacterium]|nr:formyl transferase [Chitinophagaceae bacterium]
MKDKKIVMVAGKGASTNILYNALKNEFAIEAIILEEPVSKKEFLKKRVKKLGLWKVAGQILFQLFVPKILEIGSKKRKKEILLKYNLDDSALPGEKIIHVKSVNDKECRDSLQKIHPDIVLVNGTRIISAHILNSIPARFINIHAGITPQYRGVHGGYWALVNNDKENCGVTVHFVDTGIDTGKIIYQKRITVTEKDNFVTYPLLQLAEGIPYVKKALKNAFNGTIITETNTNKSFLWYHPTIWQYLYQRLLKGKK